MYLLTFLGPSWFPVYNERTTTKTTDQIVVVLLLLLLLRKTRTHLQNNPFVLLYNSAQINWFNGEIFLCVQYTLIQLVIFGWKVGNFIFFFVWFLIAFRSLNQYKSCIDRSKRLQFSHEIFIERQRFVIVTGERGYTSIIWPAIEIAMALELILVIIRD